MKNIPSLEINFFGLHSSIHFKLYWFVCLLIFVEYGPPEQGEFEIKPTTLRNTLIRKFFLAEWIAVNTCIDFALTIFVVLQLEWGTNTISKKLPLTMEVQKLKTLCHRLFEMDSSELTIFSYNSKVLKWLLIQNYVSLYLNDFLYFQNPDLYVPLDNDLRPLSFYSIESGDIIVVKDAWKFSLFDCSTAL